MPTACDVTSEDGFRQHYLKRNNLLVNKLGLPNLLWQNARVLEAGCGSGENSLYYALHGARMTFVEPLDFSIMRLKELFGRFGVRESIQKVQLETIEAATIDEQYDVVIAEGFITTLTDKTMVIRKLFNAVAEGGFLLISTNDTTGNLIESFRATIAQLYCKKRQLTDIDQMVDAVRPFFQEDFERIPHSRPFELWAKDVLFYPLSPIDYYYDFDAIIEDLSDCAPDFYSSWPSYRPFNDLKWHKHIPHAGDATRQALEGYRLRRPSFLLGEVTGELDTLRDAVEGTSTLDIGHVREIFKATHEELRLGQTGRIYLAVERAAAAARGKAQVLLNEVLKDLTALDPEEYRSHCILRNYWGVPNHYVVLQRRDDNFMRAYPPRLSAEALKIPLRREEP